jgi:hypothetical protein
MGKCRSHGAPRWLEESYFYSQVSTGQHSACPSGKTANNKDPNVESKGYRDDFDMRMGKRPVTSSILSPFKVYMFIMKIPLMCRTQERE